MTMNPKEEPFRNIINEKKRDTRLQEQKFQYTRYTIDIEHVSRYGDKIQLSNLMKSEMFN